MTRPIVLASCALIGGMRSASVLLGAVRWRSSCSPSARTSTDLLALASREAIDQAAAAATDARALLISLVVVRAAYDDGTGVHTWRSGTSTSSRYCG